MGYATLGNPFNTALWQYTPSDDSWIEKASFPSAPRLHPVTFTTASAAYVGFGTDGAIAQQDLWKYDVVADSWSSVAAAPFNARQHAVHFTINGKGYYGGGTDDMGIPLTDFWEFNPSDESWVQKADIPLAGSFSYLPTFSLNDNRGYVLGEAGGLARFARYNPGTNTWALLSAERDCPDCSLAVINDQVLLRSFEANRIWLVKPSANQWKEIPFGGVTSGPAMFEINGLIYYGLGEYPGQGYSPQFWSFDINSVN
jgi:N-acetylneuraminic acid mutarotase